MRLLAGAPLSYLWLELNADFQDSSILCPMCPGKRAFHTACEDGGMSYYMELENGETFVLGRISVINCWDINPADIQYNEGGSIEEEPAGK